MSTRSSIAYHHSDDGGEVEGCYHLFRDCQDSRDVMYLEVERRGVEMVIEIPPLFVEKIARAIRDSK